MLLTKEEILLILKALAGGRSGYSDDPKISQLQAKLSIMLEVATRREA